MIETQTLVTLAALREAKYITPSNEALAELALRLAKDIDASEVIDPAKARELRIVLTQLQGSKPDDADGFESFSEEAGQAS